MGQTTTNTQVWTPDSTDLGQPDVYLATMSASIENGIGARLQKQEIAVGLKAGLASQFTLTSTAQLLPMVIPAVNGCFNQGFTLAGGVATVQTKGMYLISGALAIQPSSASNTSKMMLKLNSTTIITDEQISSSGFYQVSKCSTVVSCVPGDTLSMYGLTGYAGNTILTGADTSMTHFTVVMIQAVP